MANFRKIAARMAGNDGAATIEAVLWLPFFMLLLALFADLSMIFTNQNRIQRMVQDANRALAVGRFDGAEAEQAFLQDQLAALSPKAKVETQINAGRVTTIVQVPVTDLDVIGVAGAFRGSILTIRSDQLVEY